MGIDIILSLIAASGSLLLGSATLSEVVRDLVRTALGFQKKAEKPFSERLAELTTSLTRASRVWTIGDMGTIVTILGGEGRRQ